jgi:hypothetical protein
VAAEESHPQIGGCSMDSLARGCFVAEGVGLTIQGLWPKGNRYCRAYGASRWDCAGPGGMGLCGGRGECEAE